jgi:hypothetical protein
LCDTHCAPISPTHPRRAKTRPFPRARTFPACALCEQRGRQASSPPHFFEFNSFLCYHPGLWVLPPRRSAVTLAVLPLNRHIFRMK